MTEDTQRDQTTSEQILSALTRRSFLNLWSYSHPFRDQGQRSRGGEGAELCDVLVVFGNHILIFSDKSCEWPAARTPALAWARWYKRSIHRSAAQIWGAERWLSTFPGRVFLDRSCRVPLPIGLPKPEEQRFHRIVVARDPSGVRRRLTGGSGSLVIDMRLAGDSHFTAAAETARPFTVGRVDPARGFVHVFDEVALDLVMHELSTAQDFIGYLGAKEDCLASGRLVGGLGEEELLANYLINTDQGGQHMFALPTGDSPVAFEEGAWRALASRPEYRNKVIADRPSYLWDNIIEVISGYALSGQMDDDSASELATHELVLRVMAAENRFGRRVLSRGLAGIVELARDGCRRIRVCNPTKPGAPHYVFLSWGPRERLRGVEDMRAYREVRRGWLADYCNCLAALREGVRSVVGFATEDAGSEWRSYDLCMVKEAELTKEARATAQEVAEAEGWIRGLQHVEGVEYEFPPDPPAAPWASATGRAHGPARNRPCPCGGGKKFKHCHGK